jgi:preprotein translocase subunit YajC
VNDLIVAKSSNGGLFFLIIIFGLFIFLIVLPQRRRRQAAKAQVENIEVGREVLTVGGLIGKVVETDDSELKVELAPGVVVRVARRGVATVLAPDEPEEPAAEPPANPS